MKGGDDGGGVAAAVFGVLKLTFERRNLLKRGRRCSDNSYSMCKLSVRYGDWCGISRLQLDL